MSGRTRATACALCAEVPAGQGCLLLVLRPLCRTAKEAALREVVERVSGWEAQGRIEPWAASDARTTIIPDGLAMSLGEITSRTEHLGLDAVELVLSNGMRVRRLLAMLPLAPDFGSVLRRVLGNQGCTCTCWPVCENMLAVLELSRRQQVRTYQLLLPGPA